MLQVAAKYWLPSYTNATDNTGGGSIIGRVEDSNLRPCTNARGTRAVELIVKWWDGDGHAPGDTVSTSGLGWTQVCCLTRSCIRRIILKTA
jgi:hypothetical protein